MAIVRRLVESWGGTVTAESEVGQGSTVQIVIPLWAADSGEEKGE